MLPVGVTKLFVKYQNLMVMPNGPRQVLVSSAQRFRDTSCSLKHFNIFCCSACRQGLIKSLKQNLDLAEIKKFGLRIISNAFNDRSVTLATIWAKQVEYIMAQRLRRGQQMLSLYSKIWEAKAFNKLMKSLNRRRRNVLLSSCLAAVFDWEKDKIPDEVLQHHKNELELVSKLKQATVTCSKCGLRLLIDVRLPGIAYCECQNNTTSSRAVLEDWEASLASDEEWVPFIEREDVIVWRQEHKDHKGLYAYKVYGVYSDVAAKDFFAVQLDSDYRKKWDSTAIQLEVVDSDPKSGSEIVYWETQWPRFFANRDYVFKRRSLVDDQSGEIVIRAESTSHPQCPLTKSCHRVDEYWSYWVIKPTGSDMNKPGLEFSLTYFDNPGLSIPTAFASWVAMSALPEYLAKLRRAAIVLMDQRFKDEKEKHEEEEKKRAKEEESDASNTQSKASNPLLPFSLTLPEVEEPMEPLYHHQFYYL